MPKGKGHTKFAIVVVDYFTKWAEAEPIATITERTSYADLVSYTPYLPIMVSNLIMPSFVSCVPSSTSSISLHLQLILKLMAKTSHQTSTGNTPYALAFGAKAVVPIEIGMATHIVEVFQAEANDEQMNLNLDLVDERRHYAQLHNALYQQHITCYYNSHVKH
ncbi:unnamed protein product [Prunus brigantina]